MNTQGVRTSLRSRLMLSYLLVVVLTVGGVALLAGQVTVRQFRALVAQSGQIHAQGLALYFGDYYRTHGSWDDVQQAMDQLRQAQWQPVRSRLEDIPLFPWRIPPPPWLSKETIERWINLGKPQADHIMLAGPGGLVLADSYGSSPGQHSQTAPRQGSGDALSSPKGHRLSEADLARGAPVIVDGERVGTVVVDASLGRLTPQQRAFVTVIWRRLLGISVFAGVVALALSYGLARKITQPVQALTSAARRLAAGEWDQKLPVRSEDELGQMTAAFNEMAGDLARQTRLRRQMVADIAHELRTPLSVLQIELEALEDGLQSPGEAVASLRGELHLLTQLVEDLRVLAQTDAGELRLQPELTDLAALVTNTIERWQVRAAARGIQLAVHTTDDLPPVMLDRTRINQVLANLLANALRHTPKGGEIDVSVNRYTDEPGEDNERHCFVRVAVRDTGEGIPAEDLPYVFERFYRVDRARRRDTGSAGLGLAIARQLVELHGGRIWAESEEGAGSTFTFVLPE